jgi:hypothetical protein
MGPYLSGSIGPEKSPFGFSFKQPPKSPNSLLSSSSLPLISAQAIVEIDPLLKTNSNKSQKQPQTKWQPLLA